MKLTALFVGLLLAASPALLRADDLEDALSALKQAVAAKNVSQVKELAAKAHTLAAEEAKDAGTDAGKARADYAREVDTYGEYALYALAIQSPSAVAMDLVATLEKQNPKSKYLDEPQLLAMLANDALNKKQIERAQTLATRLVTVGNGKAPEGTSAADWEKSKNIALAQGYWISGVIHGERNQYRDADKDLRAALPLIKGNNGMMAPALFYLGVANYNLGRATLSKARLLEAAKFSEQAAAIPGPYQDQAYRNALQIKAEADRMR